MARVPHGTSDETIEAIMYLKDYIAMLTMEVVRYLLYVTYNTFHLSLFFTTFSPYLLVTDCNSDP